MAHAPDCARTVKRLLFCSDRFRVVRKPRGSTQDGPMCTYEFQLARSGGSVPRTLSMMQQAQGQNRTTSPVKKRSGSRNTLPKEHGRKQKSAFPAAPAPQVSGHESAAACVPPTMDAAHFSVGEGQGSSTPTARIGGDAATSKVTAEVSEEKTASRQSALDGTCSTRVHAGTAGIREGAQATDASDAISPDSLQAEMSLADSFVGGEPMDFSADFHALLPTHLQGLPPMNEAEEDLSEQLLNFREWETGFG